MPWINLTIPAGALDPAQQDWVMSQLTNALMFWENVPDTPSARLFMKGWIYEVRPGADYVAGVPAQGAASYFVEVRIPVGRLDLLAKQGIHRDFTRILMRAEGAAETSENSRRVWITINEITAEDWSIGGHADWLRSYISAIDDSVAYPSAQEATGDT
jgi:phenylpyruvate tautomerase PptA (4-oxalocrotonate tautomerase family)